MSVTGDPNKHERKSDFLSAEEIKGILQGRDKAEQERIVRWVAESLGLAPALGAIGGQPGAPPHPEQPLADGGHRVSAGLPSERKRDIKAFVEEKNPKSDIQFAAVVAYFYRFEAPEPDRKEAITSTDLQEAARLAGRPRFRKPSVPLNNAVRQGYLDRAERGSCSVNAVGENLVAMTLPSTGRDTSGPGAARKSKKRPAKRVEKQRKKPTTKSKKRPAKHTRKRARKPKAS